MKFFNNAKLLMTFKEISNALEIVSTAIRFFTFLLILFQGFMLLKEGVFDKTDKI